ncbi:MAG: hypothetical protein II838_01570 [Lachnospiraceae bacterium]|nr:hypothetical protein [Lachnospiraceae bacterium]
MVLCGEATVLDVALCIVKGLVVQSLISCVATAVFGEAAAFMLKLVGIGQDTYGLIEAIKSKDPKEIVIATVRLAVSVFTLKSQCFAGDTLVSTEEGNRRIDEIEPGDKVLSYNTETGENELQEVKNVSVSKTDILVHIITDDGRDIETTMFHPFYVKNVKNEDGTGEWKAASNLKAGDELLSEDGKKVKVSEVKVEKLAEEITVYNLELDEVHTYYVAGGVLVHNMCATDNDSDTSDSEGGKNSEVYYRTMSQEDYDYLRMTGELPATKETMISPTYSFSSNYDGVTVEFNVNSGTTNSLLEIGVGNNSAQAIKDYGTLPQVSKGWNENFAFFKGEGTQTNIGLGQGKALEIFNSNIISFKKVGGN